VFERPDDEGRKRTWIVLRQAKTQEPVAVPCHERRAQELTAIPKVQLSLLAGAAMANGRCRMHGGASTGPKTPDGLARCQTARFKHGQRSAEALRAQRLRSEARSVLALLQRLTKKAQ
jgi:hypothetical protein